MRDEGSRRRGGVVWGWVVWLVAVQGKAMCVCVCVCVCHEEDG